jgi:HD-GYP domain-containing protein (c-di-GMP phosphodiesterase class II)
MLRGRIGNVIPDLAADPSVNTARAAGARAYVGVPVRLVDGTVYGSLCCVSDHPEPALQERDVRVLDVLARIIADQIDREHEQRRSARLEGEATAGQALLAALKARERYTAEHSEAVVELSTAVAEQLGLPEEEIVQVAQVALLHDVGKLGVPEAILQKPGSLTDAEWRIVRAHPAIGERVVASIASLAHLAPAVRAEHERWDGAGYPDGLAGEDIPLIARIVLVCDAYHAMTSDRPYRAAIGEDAAVRELHAAAGSQLCPRSVRAALRVIDGARAAA